MPIRVTGLGKYLPERVMTNADLERMVETSDEWIVERTGIRERRIAADDESAATMGAAAARDALCNAGVDAGSIDLIICATCSPASVVPATAALIQQAIGAVNAAAFDVNAACAGFLSGFSLASQFIENGVYRRVLLVGSEVFSRIVDWTDRATCVLFGDGAGAVLLERAEGGVPSSVVLKNDGSKANLLYARAPAGPRSAVEAEGFCVRMNGTEVFRYAVRAMEEVLREAATCAGLSLGEIDCVVPHQANQRIISAVAKGLSVPAERVYTNVDKYGNTSSASIPIALCEAWQDGRLTPGDNVAIVAIGGGFAWGAAVFQWTGWDLPPA